MDIAGIICEFDPFHNGHAYLISKAREQGASGIVCVMSGDFMQRGGPALCDKFLRAEAAVRCGADLVLELPAVYAVNSADFFARGGIRVLNGLGCVDGLVFGSESGDIEALREIASATAFESAEFSEALRTALGNGASYPAAYDLALASVYPGLDYSVLRGPNDTLAVCYLREIIRQKAVIGAAAVKRTGGGHGTVDVSDDRASASLIRSLMKNGDGKWKDYVPEAMIDILDAPDFSPEALRLREERLFAMVRHALASASSGELRQIPEISEGLENRLLEQASYASDIEELVEGTVSGRYTSSRVSRVLTQLILGINNERVDYADGKEIAYAKVLAFNGRGAEILKNAKENGSIPVYSNINKNTEPNAPELPVLDVDIRSADIFSMICGRPAAEFSDKVQVPKML